MVGAFTVTVTAVEVVFMIPFLAVSVKLRVTGAAPAARVGAVSEARARVGVAIVTAGPAVCAQSKVSGRAGVFESAAVPVRVTEVRDGIL